MAVVLCPLPGRADDLPVAPKTVVSEVVVAETPTTVPVEHAAILPTMTVSESRQLKDQLQDLNRGPLKPEPRPTIVDGGVLLRGDLGKKTKIEAGVEHWSNLFDKDAKFTEKKSMFKIEFLRFKR